MFYMRTDVHLCEVSCGCPNYFFLHKDLFAQLALVSCFLVHGLRMLSQDCGGAKNYVARFTRVFNSLVNRIGMICHPTFAGIYCMGILTGKNDYQIVLCCRAKSIFKPGAVIKKFKSVIYTLNALNFS